MNSHSVLHNYRLRMQHHYLCDEPVGNNDITSPIIMPDVAWDDAVSQPPVTLDHYLNAGVILSSIEEIQQSHPDIIQTYITHDRLYPYHTSYRLRTFIEGHYANSLVLIIPAQVQLQETIMVEMINQRASSAAIEKIVIIAHEYSQAQVQIVAPQLTSTLQAIDCFVLPHAQLSVKTDLSYSSNTTQHLISYVTAHLSEQSAFVYQPYIANIAYYKNVLDLYLQGSAARAQVKGLYRPRHHESVSIKTVQHHIGAHTESDLLFKGVLEDNACVAYQGNILVDPTAYHTQARQYNKNIILDARARVWSIPGLEVLHHHVQCSHGSAVGPLDQEQLYYLQTRGIAQKPAEKLLIDGFCADVL